MQYYWWKLTFAVGGNVYTIGQGWATYGPWGDFDPPADCIQPYSVTRPEAPFLTSNCLSAIAGNYVTAESVVNISHYCHERSQPTLKKCRMLYSWNWLFCSVTLPSKRNSNLKVLTNFMHSRIHPSLPTWERWPSNYSFCSGPHIFANKHFRQRTLTRPSYVPI